MYRKENEKQFKIENFYLPFGGHLKKNNRWVILADQVPWDLVDRAYSESFANQTGGCPAKSARIALGSLIIKERLGTSDRETVLQIAENPYLQYFLGFSEYKDEPPFDHSLMTHFRRRFNNDTISEINELVISNAMKVKSVKNKETSDEGRNCGNNQAGNKGKLIVDATCTPADVAYPTDLNLLNEAREKTESMIDTMHEPLVGIEKKPRTYRVKARKDYLSVAKRRRPGRKKIRKAIRRQLGYLERNLSNIDKLISRGLLLRLDNKQQRDLEVIRELFRQQKFMFKNNVHKVENRIISISQPHVRPIVRGKAKSNVEFGAKISVSLVDGFCSVDRISWDNYNEAGDLVSQIEKYHNCYGYYPESVHADQIYRNRANIQYCRGLGIRLSGPPLGRPEKITSENAEQIKKEKSLHRQDEIDRIEIEGKFGQAKRRFSLSCIMAKLAATSETVIHVAFLTMNLEKILSSVLLFLFFVFSKGEPSFKNRWQEIWSTCSRHKTNINFRTVEKLITRSFPVHHLCTQPSPNP